MFPVAKVRMRTLSIVRITLSLWVSQRIQSTEQVKLKLGALLFEQAELESLVRKEEPPPRGIAVDVRFLKLVVSAQVGVVLRTAGQ